MGTGTHENHGKQWIFYEIIGGTGFIEYYIFDEKMDSWVYTDASIHPYIYNYTTEKWLAYVRTTGGGDDNPRWFYDVAAETWYFEE